MPVYYFFHRIITMSFTNYNSFFGWIPNYKAADLHKYSHSTFAEKPAFPPIIRNPNVKQVLKNWNLADTGLTLTGGFFSLFIALAASRTSRNSFWSFRRGVFFGMFNSFMFFSFLMGMTNSYERLAGLVPNGLEWENKPEEHFNQFDFSSQFLQNSPWRHVIQTKFPKPI